MAAPTARPPHVPPRPAAVGLATPFAGLVVGFVVVISALGTLVPSDAAAQDVFAQPDPSRPPVLLVPGWGDEGGTLDPLRERLTSAGWPESRVRAVAFEDPYGSSAEHAVEIGRAVETARGLTGADRVDIVAHSMGGLAVREFFRTHDEPHGVRRVVFLGTPHRGTVAAVLAWGEGGREMVPGSPFLETLNAAPGVPDGVEALAVRTPVDLRVIPASSAMLPHARNAEVCCPTHQGLLDDPATFREIRLFLLHGSEGVTVPDDTLPLRGGIPEWMDP